MGESIIPSGECGAELTINSYPPDDAYYPPKAEATVKIDCSRCDFQTVHTETSESEESATQKAETSSTDDLRRGGCALWNLRVKGSSVPRDMPNWFLPPSFQK